MELQIQQMKEQHLPAMLCIQSRCYTEVQPESMESLRSKLRASPATCFVALSSRNVVGYLISVPWSECNVPSLNDERCSIPEKPDCLYLHDLAVIPSARSLGVGHALVGRFLTVFHALKLSRAILIAVQESAPYWRRQGFQERIVDGELSRSLRGYGDGAVFMERCAAQER